ncbi:MAG: hypothetical protein IJW47_03390 [Clostridia bacterium]|nr:hypothetical protein [Clostridia bacterium]
MLDNTRKAVDKVKRDIDVIKWILEYGINILTLIYLAVSLVFGFGDFIVNVALLIITGLFVIFNIVYGKKELSKKQKKIARKKYKNAKKVLNVCKLTIKTYYLGIILYAMAFSTAEASSISIILTTLMIIAWVLSVTVELVKLIFELEKDRIIDGIKADFEWAEKTKNFVNEQVDKAKQTVVHVVEETKEKINDAKSAVHEFFHREDKTKEQDK